MSPDERILTNDLAMDMEPLRILAHQSWQVRAVRVRQDDWAEGEEDTMSMSFPSISPEQKKQYDLLAAELRKIADGLERCDYENASVRLENVWMHDPTHRISVAQPEKFLAGQTITVTLDFSSRALTAFLEQKRSGK